MKLYHALTALCCCLLLLPDVSRAAVGRTQGIPSVSPAGVGSYTIPLRVPPGRAGLEPNLSLVYSHASGNGTLGMGWSIGGLSAITRCPRTIAQDGGPGGITMTSADRFCLDGQRLRLLDTQQTYGAAGTNYGTEIETYSLIKAKGTAGTGPSWFEVKLKNGLTYHYGNSSSSKIESVGAGQTVRTWALSKIWDRSDNYIEFQYEENTPAGSGNYRVKSILYTGATAATPTHSVEFIYADRTTLGEDVLVRYVGGGVVSENKRLTSIEVRTPPGQSGTLVHKYALAYETLATPARSRLDSITECGEVDCFAPTTFNYTVGAGGWDAPYPGGLGVTIGTMAHAHAGDFNGDGRDDLAYFDATGSVDAWQMLLANASDTVDHYDTNHGGTGSVHYQGALQIDLDGNGKRDLLTPDGNPLNWWWLHQSASGGWIYEDTQRPATGWEGKSWVLDVDGDGLEDIVFVSDTGTKIQWRRNTGGALAATPTDVYTEPSGWTFTSKPFGSPARTFADFDGDGRGDLVVTLTESPGEWTSGATDRCEDVFAGCFNCDCDAIELNLCTDSPPTAACELDPECYTVASPDFTEWACSGSYRFQVLYGAAGGFTTGPDFSSLGPSAGHADFNGDGYSDIYFISGTWRILFSEGKAQEFADEVDTGQSGTWSQTIPTDWDGDGKSDLLFPGGNSKWHYLRSDGETLETAVDTQIPATGASGYPKVLDLDGKGLPDLFYVQSGNVANRRLHAGAVPDLLDVATDGFGNFVDFKYASLTNSTYYTKLQGATFPTQDYQSPAKVVHEYSHSNGVGGTYKMKYRYEGARVHLQGRGFLGFSERTVTDTRLNNYTVETYEQDTAAWERIGALSSAVTRTNPNAAYPAPADVKIVEAFLDWESVPSTSGETRRFPYVHEQTVKNYEINSVGGTANPLVSTVVTTVSVDSYGTAYDTEVETTEKNTGNHAETKKKERVWHSVLENEPHEDIWCLGRPTTTKLINSHELADGTEVIRTIGRDWDMIECRLNHEALEPGDQALQLKTVYSYDEFGNVEKVSVQPIGMAARDTDIYWGTDGRFPVTVTNPEGHVTGFAWDTERGLLEIQTDPNDLDTDWDYDDLDRLILETSPESIKTARSYLACSSDPDCSTLAHAKLKVLTTVSKGATTLSESFTVHDGFGRLRRASRHQIAGGLSDVLTEWRGSGLPFRQSQPHFSGGTAVWTTFTFDAMARAKQIDRAATNDEDASVATATFKYEGLKTIATDPPIGTDPGVTTTRIANAWGAIARVIDDDGNDVDYEYDAFGNLTTTRDVDDNEINLTYNVRGFKLSSSDPDMGAGTYRWDYTYYPTGDLHTQTDAKEQTVSFVYDKLSRPKTRDEPEGVTTWTWGSTQEARNIGQLEKVVTDWGYQESYVYDEYARPYTATTKIGTVNYAIDYRYSTATQLLQDVYYPTTAGFTRFRVRHEFDTTNKSGMLKAVKDYTGGSLQKTFWAADATDAFGQYIDVNVDDGELQTFIDFDSITGAPKAITSGASGGSEMQDLAYSWNRMGRLTSPSANMGETPAFPKLL